MTLFGKQIEVKLLQFYYGNPAKDLKLIIVAGNSGVNTTAHYIHETLKLADAKTGLVLNANTPAKFYHRLAKIWRNGANHAVIAEANPPLPTPVRSAAHLLSASKQNEQPAITIEISIITIYVKLFVLYNFIIYCYL